MEKEKNEDIETSKNNEQDYENDYEDIDLEDEDNSDNSEDNSDNSEDNSDNSEGSEVQELQEKLKELEDKNKQLYARIQKSNKEPKKLTKENIENEKDNSDEFEEAIDIRFLKRDGYTEEDISRLKVIRDGYKSSGKTISLIEASNDELFKAVMDKKKEEERKKKAQLGASYGAGQSAQKKMTNEEFEKHRKEKSEEFLRGMGL